MPPGARLTALTEDAWQRGLDRLTDDELVGVLRAARRLASRAAALELSVVADLAARRRAALVPDGGPPAGEHVDAEIAAALTLTTRSAAVLHDLALGVTRLPGTLKALAAGRIDQPRAAVIASGTSALDDWAAMAVSAVVIRAAPGQTTGQLRAAVQQAVIWVDPEAARRRKEAAQKQARVELWREPAGTCTLAGRDLPPGFALAADKHLTAAAQWLKEHGADGSLGQLRAKAFMILLNGQPVIPFAPGGGGAAGACWSVVLPGGAGMGPMRARLAMPGDTAIRQMAMRQRRCGAGWRRASGAIRVGEPDPSADHVAGLDADSGAGPGVRPAGRAGLPHPRGHARASPGNPVVPDPHQPGGSRGRPRLRSRQPRTSARQHGPPARQQ